MQLKEFSQEILPTFDNYLETIFSQKSGMNQLGASMWYSLSNGGKRIRPLLLLATLKAFMVNESKGFQAAAALEAIHTYSLIHDDLPAMDDDDYRRGKLTNHKQFDEATAILAGDALLTEAFHLISEPNSEVTPAIQVQLVNLLSATAGRHGMVGGQMGDMLGENHGLSLSELQTVHSLKTGELIRFALVGAGFIGEVSEAIKEKLAQFAYHYGLAYQIQNDLQEVLWTDEQRGKKQSGDQAHHKNTYPELLTTEGAKRALTEEIANCNQILDEIKQLNSKFDSELMSGFLEYLEI